MSSARIQNVAFFKVRSTNSIPLRPGPVQCIRNCTNCIIRTSDETRVVDSEELISMMSFDNLVSRKSLWLFKYQSLQYHVGQIDLLNGHLKLGMPLTIYIVATSSFKDLKLMDMIFNHVQIPCPHPVCIQTTSANIIVTLMNEKTIAIPIKMRSCVTDKFPIQFTKDEACFGSRQLKGLLEPCIQTVADDKDFDLNIVQVTITKDHDDLALYGLGSACVQISEPYKLSAYLRGLLTPQKSTHLVQHIYYDAAQSASLLPAHLVAFLILYLETGDGLELSTLVEYIDWLKKVSIDMGMHFGFTGSSLKAVEFALVILKDFVYLSYSKYYVAKDIESLMDYADLVTPIIAYNGIIAKAVLMEYNRDKPKDAQLGALAYGVRIRVRQDKVIKTSRVLAEQLERRIPCRRPCVTIDRCVEDTISQMSVFGHYFKIEEPLIAVVNRNRRWAGDSDDEEEEYFQRNRDNPAFKSWLLLSGRDYRRDRLNMFINSINLHLV